MRIFSILVLIGIQISVYAQDRPNYFWLTGSWQGPGFGGQFEEIWSEPDANDVIIGMFRYTDGDGNTQFTEFWQLDSTGLKLKHFNPDFTGWEEKDDYLHFKMIEVLENKVILKGLIYELLPDGKLKISLDMKKDDGVKTEVFLLERASLLADE